MGSVTIGRNSTVLDNAHVSAPAKGLPTRIGDDVVVSPGAVVQSAEVGDGAMIGMGAIVRPGAKVGADSFVDAGAVVAAGAVIPPGQLWTGSPARCLRALSPEEMKFLRSSASLYGGLGQRHWEQAGKSVGEVEEEAEWADYKVVKGMSPDDAIATPDADVVKYYDLTAPTADHGVFRDAEIDQPAEFAAREAEEVAADAAENAHYQAAARTQ